MRPATSTSRSRRRGSSRSPRRGSKLETFSPRSRSPRHPTSVSPTERRGKECFIAVFQGMYQEGRRDNYELTLIEAYKDVMRSCGYKVFEACFTPPVQKSFTQNNETFQHWADYTTVDYNNSLDVPELQSQLNAADAAMSSKVYEWVTEQVRAERSGVFVGISNGALMASNMALWAKSQSSEDHPILLLLLSGLPAEQQMNALEYYYNRRKPGHLTITVGSSESYWRRLFYGIADKLFADVVTFQGKHASEPEELMERLGRMAAKKICRQHMGPHGRKG